MFFTKFFAVCAIGSVVTACATASFKSNHSNHPLLTYAVQHTYSSVVDESQYETGLLEDLRLIGKVQSSKKQESLTVDDRRKLLAYIFDNMGYDYDHLNMRILATVYYMQAVTLDGDNSGYHGDLGVELESLDKMNEAFKELQKATDFSSKKSSWLLESFGIYYYRSGNWQEAIQNFESEMQAPDSQDQDQLYAQIRIYLAQEHLGRKSSSVTSAVTERNKRVWPAPILNYLSGSITEAALLNDVESVTGSVRRQRLCEALYYEGEQALIHRQISLAEEYFRAVISTRVVSYNEYVLALNELKQLGYRD